MAETETGWTEEWPANADAFYWLRDNEGRYRDRPCHVDGDRIIGLLDHSYTPRGDCQYEVQFLGPISPSDAAQLMELRQALEWAVARLEDNERWWHQAGTLTTLTAFEKQAFEARAQTTRTTLDHARAALNPSHLPKETQ